MSKGILYKSLVLVLVFAAATAFATPFDWQLQTVEDVDGPIEGSINAIAVSPVDGDFHLAYRVVTTAKLHHAVGTEEPYSINSDIEEMSGNFRWIGTDVGDDGVVWVISSNSWSGGYVDVCYSENSGSSFSVETLATGACQSTDIAVRSSDDQPAAVYSTTVGGSFLRYAVRTGALTWTTSDVIDSSSVADEFKGRYEDAKIALTSADEPIIVCRNDWRYDLIVAVPDGAGGWTLEIAAEDVMNSNADGDNDDDDQYSRVLDVAVDSNDNAVIAYTNTSGLVKVLRRTAANTYEVMAVTTTGIARSVSIAVDVDDIAYIAYNNVSAGDLMLATGDLGVGAFNLETVVSNSVDGLNVQRYLDVALQSNGLPVISFFPVNVPSMRLAKATSDIGLSCEDIINMGQGIKGDLNEDCYVNMVDFAMMATNWLTCNNPMDPGCE